MTVRNLFHKHHRRQIVKIPVCRDLDQTSLLALLEWFPPLGGLLIIIDLGPVIASPEVVCLTIVVIHTMVVLDAISEQQFCRFFRYFPPWSYCASRRSSVTEICQHT